MFLSQWNLSFHLLTSQHLGKNRRMKCEHNTHGATSRRLNGWNLEERRLTEQISAAPALKQRELKEQTWFEAADSAKGTLVTGVEVDETVEVVAPCIMGTFIRAFQTKDRGRGCGREGGGDRNDMVTMAKCAGSKVMAQVQWYCQDEFEQVSRHMQERKRNYIYLSAKRKKRPNYTHEWTKKQGNTPSYNPIRLDNLIIVFKWMGQEDEGSEGCENSLSASTVFMSRKLTYNSWCHN